MFVLEPESTESLQATLAFLDEALPSPSSKGFQPLDGEWSPNWRAIQVQNDAMLDVSEYLSPIPVLWDSATISTPVDVISSVSTTANVAPVVLPSSRARMPTTQLVPAPPPTQASRSKKTRKFNPNKARDDRKRELNYLRNEVEELEFKLNQLQAVKANRAIGWAEDQESLSLVPGNSGGNPCAWEHTCARQLEGRLRVERENIHLKTLLESQIQVAKSMEKLLNKRTKLTPTESSGSNARTTRVHVSRGGNAAADAAMYDELNVGVEVSYREIETVFASNEFVYADGPLRKAQMRDGANGMLLEIYDSKVMPFSMHATGEAWWRRWNHSNPNRCGFRIESTDDSIVEHFGMEMSDTKTKTTAKFYVQQRLRRYVEEHRVVVVWQSHIEPLEFSNKKLAGIRFREKGYVVIKPHEVPGDSEDEAYTLVQTCHKITPDLSDQRLNGDAKTGALTEFVLGATNANISASTEMIENLLVDSELKQRSRM